jgi:tRNA wybutosine-synthesizing protein 2
MYIIENIIIHINVILYLVIYLSTYLMKQTPYHLIEKNLKSEIPENLIRHLPKKWEINGNVVIIRFSDELNDFKQVIGKIYANVLSCKSTLRDIGGITGEFREPNTDLIWGDENTETTHIENKIKYCFNPMKIMFSSGNIDERIRMAYISNPDEIIVDLFAGIGYFSLPLAVYSKPIKIYACELNKVSYDYLCKNIILNHVSETVKSLYGDNRKTAPLDVADRVIMGYFKNTKDFLPIAMKCLKNNVGIIHYHDVFSDEKIPEIAIKQIQKHFTQFNRKMKLIEYRQIKTYAPGISHYVFDIEIRK